MLKVKLKRPAKKGKKEVILISSLTAEDFPVGAPEFCGFGRPAVELISVRSQNQPKKE